MKIEKRVQVILGFIVALIIFLLITCVITGFKPGLKDIISSIYFAVWIAAAVGIWSYIMSPFIHERINKRSDKASKKNPEKIQPIPSPHPDLPLRERIHLYVTERRQEEGLPIPEPLVIAGLTDLSRSGRFLMSSDSSGSFAKNAASISVVPESSAGNSIDDADLPFPDDFDSDYDNSLSPDELPAEDEGGLLLSDIEDEQEKSGETITKKRERKEDADSLPDLEDELDLYGSEPDIDESLMDYPDTEDGSETGMQDLHPKPRDDFDISGAEDGFPDIDDIQLDDDMMESELSGDEDLSDIEFEDLEPDKE